MEDEPIFFPVYLTLTALTLASAASYWWAPGRIVAVGVALAIAGMKSSLIGLYFMHLRHEKPLIHGVVAAGALAAMILGIGILPDIGLRLQGR